MPKYGEKGDRCSLFQPCSSLQLPLPPRAPNLKKSKMLAAGEEGLTREVERRERSWHCVSHKSTAAASLALPGLMRGVVTASLNSCQTGPWEGDE